MMSDTKATNSTRVPVALDGALLRRLVALRFPRGVNDFLDTWHNSTDARGRPFVKAPSNRTTVYRWFKGDLPGSSDTLIELSLLLGIDFFALMTTTCEDPAATSAKFMAALETGLWQHKSMAAFSDFFGRRIDWPPPAIGARVADGWHMFDFEHHPEIAAGVYGSFRLVFPPEPHPDIPKIVHVAYRHRPHFGGRWLQYGFVRITGTQISLVNINGGMETGSAPEATGPFTIETVFGLGPADFRLASLTPFSATGHYEPSTDPGRVGFR